MQPETVNIPVTTVAIPADIPEPLMMRELGDGEMPDFEAFCKAWPATQSLVLPALGLVFPKFSWAPPIVTALGNRYAERVCG